MQIAKRLACANSPGSFMVDMRLMAKVMRAYLRSAGSASAAI